MTREEAMQRLSDLQDGSGQTYEAIRMAIEAPSADAVDCTDFIEWLVDRVLDETIWENNSVAYGEIICRKLEKLGVLETTEEPSYYIRHIENNTKPSDLVYRPSADAESDDLIIKGAKGIQDGLYNIKDGKLFEYKRKGGTVRTYPIIKL